MNKHIILTGIPGVGKTTLIKRLIEGKTGIRGFFTEEIRDRGKRVGFKIVTLSGKEGILAHVGISSPYKVAKYGVDLAGFESLGVKELEEGIAQRSPLIVIDEIGKMELLSERFIRVLERVLEESKLLATMGKIDHPLVRAIRMRKDVDIIEVTPQNRDGLVHQLKIFQSSSPSE